MKLEKNTVMHGWAQLGQRAIIRETIFGGKRFNIFAILTTEGIVEPRKNLTQPRLPKQ